MILIFIYLHNVTEGNLFQFQDILIYIFLMKIKNGIVM